MIQRIKEIRSCKTLKELLKAIKRKRIELTFDVDYNMLEDNWDITREDFIDELFLDKLIQIECQTLDELSGESEMTFNIQIKRKVAELDQEKLKQYRADIAPIKNKLKKLLKG